MERSKKVEFKPTQEQIEAAKLVFVAMAWVETIRPIVNGYQVDVLKRHNWTNHGIIAKLRDKGIKRAETMEIEIIENPEHIYMLSDEESAIYFKECNEERIKANLYVSDPEFCPLLVAESQLREAKWELVRVMEPITKLNQDMLSGSLENLQRFMDLTLSLLAKYCK